MSCGLIFTKKHCFYINISVICAKETEGEIGLCVSKTKLIE